MPLGLLSNCCLLSLLPYGVFLLAVWAPAQEATHTPHSVPAQQPTVSKPRTATCSIVLSPLTCCPAAKAARCTCWVLSQHPVHASGALSPLDVHYQLQGRTHTWASRTMMRISSASLRRTSSSNRRSIVSSCITRTSWMSHRSALTWRPLADGHHERHSCKAEATAQRGPTSTVRAVDLAGRKHARWPRSRWPAVHSSPGHPG